MGLSSTRAPDLPSNIWNYLYCTETIAIITESQEDVVGHEYCPRYRARDVTNATLECLGAFFRVLGIVRFRLIVVETMDPWATPSTPVIPKSEIHPDLWIGAHGQGILGATQ